MTGGLTPKTKKSRSRTRSRRAVNRRLSPSPRATCGRCNEVIRPHHACSSCGYYNGREYEEAVTSN